MLHLIITILRRDKC